MVVIMTLNPNVPPSSNFSLGIFTLTLPIPEKQGSTDPLTITNTQLAAGYTNPSYFYTSSVDGSLVFKCPAVGVTTSNSDFPRVELREIGTENKDWALLTGSHLLQAKVQVVHSPTIKGIYIGQIHGDNSSDQPQIAKLLWAIDNTVSVQIKNDANPTGDEITYQLGQYTLGETITYAISMIPTATAGTSTLTVTINHYDTTQKKDVATTNSFPFMNTYWDKQTYYFKAGAYVQENKAGTTDYGEVHFLALTVTHSTSTITLPPPAPVGPPVTPPVTPTATPTVTPTATPTVTPTPTPTVTPTATPATITIPLTTYNNLLAIQAAAKAIQAQITQIQSLLS